MEKLTEKEIIEINKRIGERGTMISSSLSTIIYSLADVDDRDSYAAKLICDIINLHPFVDGNKRTAFYSLVMFLKKNGYALRKEYKYNDKIDRLIGHIVTGRSENHVRRLLRKMIVDENE